MCDVYNSGFLAFEVLTLCLDGGDAESLEL
jgi:hypothetical protein